MHSNQLSTYLHVVGLIKERPLDQWRDTLAVIGSHSQLDEFNDLTCALGKRLNSAGEVPEDMYKLELAVSGLSCLPCILGVSHHCNIGRLLGRRR